MESDRIYNIIRRENPRGWKESNDTSILLSISKISWNWVNKQTTGKARATTVVRDQGSALSVFT